MFIGYKEYLIHLISNIYRGLYMSSQYTNIEGSAIRKMLRDRNLPGGKERTCCGGRSIFSKDYESQLKALKMTGRWAVTEKGILMDKIVVA